jgi:hypothetical protein
MRYAIIDNSTLTSIQRLLGQITVVNGIALDGDIAAFETLIQTILFYDTIFYIDDYKSEFKEGRRKAFRFATPINTNDIPYNELISAAESCVDEIALQVKGGRIEPNQIGKFLRDLNMQTTFTWDMQSSNFFLTLKMLQGEDSLDIHKYTALNEMIFLELSANKGTAAPQPESPYKFVSSNGKPIPKISYEDEKKYEVSKQVSAFASSLNWLALRTAFYSYVSNHYNADAILHPIRSAFQMSLGARLGINASIYRPIIDRFADETTTVVREIKKNTDPVVTEMSLPLLSAWLVNKAGNPSNAIQAAFELRNKPPVQQARQKLSELEELHESRDHKHYVREVNRLILEIQSAGDTLRKLYYVKPKNGVSLSPLIVFFNSIGGLKGLPKLPNIPLKIKTPNKLLELSVRNGFKGMCRSVTQDLVAISRLGEYYEKMTSEVRYENDMPNNILAKVEEKRFLGRSSFWKRPM